MLIRQILILRDEKRLGDQEIEKRLGLKSGIVSRLGRAGIVGEAAEVVQEKGGALG